MPGAGRDIQVRLYRDSLSTPWGFRLHGGKDLKTPLTIQKVTLGTPVFGELQKDDLILEIQGNDATKFTHKQAQDMIRNAGGSMLMRVRRCGRMEQAPAPTQSYDHIGPVQRSSMLGRVRSTLSGVTPSDYSSSGYGSNHISDYDLYSPTSSHASGDSGSGRYTIPSHKSNWRSQPNNTNLSEPGWTPRTVLERPRPQITAVNSLSSSQPHPHHRQYPVAPPPAVHHHQNVQPAWYGSLRSATDPRRHDRQVGGALHHSLSPEPPSSYAAPGSSAASSLWLATQPVPGGAKNLQYNTPIGLYSKSTAQETIHRGAANNESMIARHGADSHGNGSSVAPGRFLHADQPSDEVIRQSPSIRLLESRFVYGEGRPTEDSGQGMSDF